MHTPLIKLFSIAFILAGLVAFSWYSVDNAASSDAIHCDVNTGMCDEIAGIKLTFESAIVANKPMLVRFRLPESAQQQVPYFNATLTGQEMYMGITQTQLTRVAQTNLYQGELRIPVCTTSAMSWQLSISVPDADVEPLHYQFTLMQP
jgi:hypothetical protein